MGAATCPWPNEKVWVLLAETVLLPLPVPPATLPEFDVLDGALGVAENFVDVLGVDSGGGARGHEK